jgi:hypothetical protein
MHVLKVSEETVSREKEFPSVVVSLAQSLKEKNVRCTS